MSVILPTESRRLHAQAEYAGVHNNNSRITPALSAFSRVCTNTCLTDAVSVSLLLSMPAYYAWACDRLDHSRQNDARVRSVFSFIYDSSISIH